MDAGGRVAERVAGKIAVPVEFLPEELLNCGRHYGEALYLEELHQADIHLVYLLQAIGDALLMEFFAWLCPVLSTIELKDSGKQCMEHNLKS